MTARSRRPAALLALLASVTLAQPDGAAGDVAGPVDIGGRALYLACRGEGAPTVLLEAGYRSSADVWTTDLVRPDAPRTMVMDGVAAFTRVCLYERPGVAAVLDDGLHESRSDPVPMPRSAESVVADLHALLEAGGVPAPFVLVGHSLGGLFVRLYASTYPDEVAGLVLVDAWSEELETLLLPAEWEAYVRLNYAPPPELAGYADLETLDFDAASDAVRRAAEARPPPAVPLAVLAHGRPFGLSEAELGFSPAALEAAWRGAQEALARLEPEARFEIATESSHYVQLEQPALVIEAVRAVVAEARAASAGSETR